MISLAKQRVNKVFQETIKDVSLGKTPNISGTMRKHGYSHYSAKALKVTQTKTWAELWQKNFPPERVQALINKILSEYETQDKIEDKRSAQSLIEFLAKATPNALPKESMDVDLRFKRESFIEA